MQQCRRQSQNCPAATSKTITVAHARQRCLEFSPPTRQSDYALRQPLGASRLIFDLSVSQFTDATVHRSHAHCSSPMIDSCRLWPLPDDGFKPAQYVAKRRSSKVGSCSSFFDLRGDILIAPPSLKLLWMLIYGLGPKLDSTSNLRSTRAARGTRIRGDGLYSFLKQEETPP